MPRFTIRISNIVGDFIFGYLLYAIAVFGSLSLLISSVIYIFCIPHTLCDFKNILSSSQSNLEILLNSYKLASSFLLNCPYSTHSVTLVKMLPTVLKHWEMKCINWIGICFRWICKKISPQWLQCPANEYLFVDTLTFVPHVRFSRRWFYRNSQKKKSESIDSFISFSFSDFKKKIIFHFAH